MTMWEREVLMEHILLNFSVGFFIRWTIMILKIMLGMVCDASLSLKTRA